jgi:transposase
VGALIAAGYRVYAINPLQVARFRERHQVSGAKSDPQDAHTLADMVRTDRHQLRPVAGESDLAEAIKVFTRAHKTLIWERTRHLLRLRHGRGGASAGVTQETAVARPRHACQLIARPG